MRKNIVSWIPRTRTTETQNVVRDIKQTPVFNPFTEEQEAVHSLNSWRL